MLHVFPTIKTVARRPSGVIVVVKLLVLAEFLKSAPFGLNELQVMVQLLQFFVYLGKTLHQLLLGLREFQGSHLSSASEGCPARS